jgi:peptide/nickel transport system permease protein
MVGEPLPSALNTKPAKRGVALVLSSLAANIWLRFLVRRLCGLALVLFGLVIVTFMMVRLIPGDPARLIGGLNASGYQLELIRHRLGIDRPAIAQFVSYMRDLLHGNLGTSFSTEGPVSQIISVRIGSSLQLAFAALGLALVLGIAGGLIAGALTSEGRHRRFELGFTGAASVVGALPEFLAATFLAYALGVWLRVLPVADDGTWRSLVLPAVSVGLPSAAFLMRVVRTETLDVLGSDYMRTARSKRLSPGRLYVRHVLPNVMAGALSVAGLVFANVVGGAVIVENVFARAGLGTALVSSVLARDYPTTQALVLVLGIFVVGVNALVDIVLSVIDPRSLTRHT